MHEPAHSNLLFDDVEVLDFAGPFEVFSVGALMLGTAGLLTGRQATTHFMAFDELQPFATWSTRETGKVRPRQAVKSHPATAPASVRRQSAARGRVARLAAVARPSWWPFSKSTRAVPAGIARATTG